MTIALNCKFIAEIANPYCYTIAEIIYQLKGRNGEFMWTTIHYIFWNIKKLARAFHRNKISILVLVNKSVKKVWTNNVLHNISRQKIFERMGFKWLPKFVRKKIVKILLKITSIVVQNEIQNIIELNFWKGFM